MCDYLDFNGGKWDKLTDYGPDSVSFNKIKFYYANIIDYLRIALVIISIFTICYGYPLTSASLIMFSTFLDWIDGPVARYFNQCCIFGSGIDWVADILCQLIVIVWLAKLNVSDLWLIPIFIFTSIEIGLAVFDFGMTTTGKYPTFKNRGKLCNKKLYGKFYYILDLSMPNHVYSNLGDFLWISYPIFTLALCLNQYPSLNGYILNMAMYLFAIPTLLYIWCETAYLFFIIRYWRELSRKADNPFPLKSESVYSVSQLLNSK